MPIFRFMKKKIAELIGQAVIIQYGERPCPAAIRHQDGRVCSAIAAKYLRNVSIQPGFREKFIEAFFLFPDNLFHHSFRQPGKRPFQCISVESFCIIEVNRHIRLCCKSDCFLISKKVCMVRFDQSAVQIEYQYSVRIYPNPLCHSIANITSTSQNSLALYGRI